MITLSLLREDRQLVLVNALNLGIVIRKMCGYGALRGAQELAGQCSST